MPSEERQLERQETQRRLEKWNQLNHESNFGARASSLANAYHTKFEEIHFLNETRERESAALFAQVEKIPALHALFNPPTKPLAAPETLKVISSSGTNAALLAPGESCLSLLHSFCALIVLTNGTRSFALHCANPDYVTAEELTAMKIMLGGNVNAKIYQSDMLTHLPNDQDRMARYTAILEQVVGPHGIIEKVPTTNAPHYLVASDGSVAILNNTLLTQLQHAQLPAHLTFDDLHRMQFVEPNTQTPGLCIADIHHDERIVAAYERAKPSL